MNHGAAFVKIVEEARKGVRECSVSELKARLEQGPVLLIDVREQSEYAAGHLPGAKHIGKGVIERDIEAAVPDPTSEILLYCGGGYRSVLAAVNLQKMGYSKVISVDGGFRGWQDAGFPLEGRPSGAG